MLTCLIALPRPVLEKVIRYVSTGKNLLRKLVDIYTIFREAISKRGNGEWRNGEWGTGNGEWGISKRGNL